MSSARQRYAPPSTAFYTDQYEFTMLASALRDGTARRRCVFEAFARRLPAGRRYGMVAGVGRLLEAVAAFRFTAERLDFLRGRGVIDDLTRDWLAGYRFGGDIDAYAEGELYFPGSPVLTVTGTFGEAVVLETLVLSILNHDCAIASAAARMVSAAGGRPLMDMGSRRTHEEAAVGAARAAYVAGFSSTSNVEAGFRYGLPTVGTAAHAYTLLHDDERAAFRGQVEALGRGTTLLVDTYDITQGIANAVAVAGTSLGAVRIDSGDLAVLAHQARAQLDELGASQTKIVMSGDLDEYSIAALGAAPVDAYGVGTALVTGSGAPTAGMVYKLVEVEGRPVVKRSEHKATRGGRKRAVRLHKPTGTAVSEIVTVGSPASTAEGAAEEAAHARSTGEQAPAPSTSDFAATARSGGVLALQRPVLRGGEPVAGLPTLSQSRELARERLVSLPWEGLKLSAGEPAVPVIFEEARRWPRGH